MAIGRFARLMERSLSLRHDEFRVCSSSPHTRLCRLPKCTTCDELRTELEAEKRDNAELRARIVELQSEGAYR